MISSSKNLFNLINITIGLPHLKTYNLIKKQLVARLQVVF
ncbi:hypothetical protein BCAH1134_C0472 (plasmid) [Bacillus cereus AH1134]|nr:hypothetical protein BCAH1134_C0472 [Bacillus cereus AH1134]